jgi:methyl-accepting chemotaxis protein
VVRVGLHAGILLAEAAALLMLLTNLERPAAQAGSALADSHAARASEQAEARDGRHGLAHQMESTLGGVAGQVVQALAALGSASARLGQAAASAEELATTVAEVTRQVAGAAQVARQASSQAAPRIPWSMG